MKLVKFWYGKILTKRELANKFLELQEKIEQRVKKKKERLKLDKKKKCQNVLPLKKLDQWIQTIGNINLEKYKEKILEESED